jgi:hypothetical protein
MSTAPIDYKALAKTHGAISSVHESDMPDYSEVPEFLKENLDMSRVQQVVTPPKTEEDKKWTAQVNKSDPYKIEVLADDLYGPPILNHELTHTFQFTRNKDIGKVSSPIQGNGLSIYNYGGVQGLQDARTHGKTISDFNSEQQAEMVKDYKFYHDQYLKKAAEGKITAEDEKKMYELQQAYHPFIQQLAAMPGVNEKIDRNALLELVGLQKPVAINTKPEPPGLPAYNTPGLGMLPADPLMGGKSQPTPTPKVPMDPRLAAVQKQFPRLAPYLSKVMIQQGKKTNPNDDRGLEFYPPWESENPNPGKITLELFDRLQGPTLTTALGGDLLHYLGGVDPKSGKPVDPEYYAMKQAVLKARTPQQQAMDQREYANAVKNEGEKRPFAQWLQQSRIDAYIRGYVTPELGGKYPDEWRKQGQYKSPAMLKAVEAIRQYVTTAPQYPTLEQIKAKAAQLRPVGVK